MASIAASISEVIIEIAKPFCATYMHLVRVMRIVGMYLQIIDGPAGTG